DARHPGPDGPRPEPEPVHRIQHDKCQCGHQPRPGLHRAGGQHPREDAEPEHGRLDAESHGLHDRGYVTTIDLNVTATDLRYTWVSPLYNSSAEVGDGMLNTLAFDFHLVVTVEDKTLTLPWYKVTVSGLSREITEVTFEGNRTISGPSIVMGAKYDHVIEGWDFADLGNRLALETHLI